MFTRILGEEEKIYEHIPWYSQQSPAPVNVPPIDVEAVLEQDRRDSTGLSRYGIKEPMNLDKGDGTLYQYGNFAVWKLHIRSESAKSLNFEFSNLNLPAGSAMFIHGMNEKMVHGPVHADKVHDGIYASDIIIGDSAIIEVFLPDGVEAGFSVALDNVIHGIDLSGVGSRAFGDSGPCNINVACPQGNGWENEISSVCLIFKNTVVEHCTGTLINNECNDFTPFVLTAEHCVAGENLNNFVFRFNYESISCPQAIEPNSNIWFSFSGAQLRASWADTDFALLELNNPVTSVAFSGWNRTNTTPPNTTCIHHPESDVKKISIDNDPPVISGSFLDVIWDAGTTEPGSSGSALFDNNQLIIGQLRGGSASCSNPTGIDNYGRLFNSWTGGGTNATRLSNWLGGTNNPIAVNTLVVPSISGTGALCISGKTYTLQDPIPGYAVTWSVSPASLFGSPTSGSGISATLWPASNAAQGAATLTYTLTSADCGTQTFTKVIWVGKPVLTGISGPECFTPGTNVSVSAIVQGATGFSWAFPSCPNGPPIGDPDPDCWFNYTGNQQQVFIYVGQQSGSISVWASNECGASSINLPIVFCEGEPPGDGTIIRSESNDGSEGAGTMLPARVVAYPNPAGETLTVELAEDFYPAGEPKNIQLLDISGRAVYRTVISGNSLRIDAGDFPPGIFYLKVRYRDGFVFQKIIVH